MGTTPKTALDQPSMSCRFALFCFIPLSGYSRPEFSEVSESRKSFCSVRKGCGLRPFMASCSGLLRVVCPGVEISPQHVTGVCALTMGVYIGII